MVVSTTLHFLIGACSIKFGRQPRADGCTCIDHNPGGSAIEICTTRQRRRDRDRVGHHARQPASEPGTFHHRRAPSLRTAPAPHEHPGCRGLAGLAIVKPVQKENEGARSNLMIFPVIIAAKRDPAALSRIVETLDSFVQRQPYESRCFRLVLDRNLYRLP